MCRVVTIVNRKCKDIVYSFMIKLKARKTHGRTCFNAVGE